MLSAVACMPSFGSTSQLTDCEFSAVQELLVVATGEGNSSIQAWCGQKNAEDSGAQPDTQCRWFRVFWRGCSCCPAGAWRSFVPLLQS